VARRGYRKAAIDWPEARSEPAVDVRRMIRPLRRAVLAAQLVSSERSSRPVVAETSRAERGGDADKGENKMATPERRIAGISVGGIIVIAGILMMLFWSFWIGLIVVLIGLIAFGGFVRGRWY
jgi:hypothetical protein